MTEDGLVDFKARGGVVITTGGFSANREMLCGYLGGVMSRLPLRGSSYVTGENITLTKSLFAKLVHMDQFHCGPIVSATSEGRKKTSMICGQFAVKAARTSSTTSTARRTSSAASLSWPVKVS